MWRCTEPGKESWAKVAVTSRWQKVARACAIDTPLTPVSLAPPQTQLHERWHGKVGRVIQMLHKIVFVPGCGCQKASTQGMLTTLRLLGAKYSTPAQCCSSIGDRWRVYRIVPKLCRLARNMKPRTRAGNSPKRLFDTPHVVSLPVALHHLFLAHGHASPSNSHRRHSVHVVLIKHNLLATRVALGPLG